MIDNWFDIVKGFFDNNVFYYFDDYPRKIKKDHPWIASFLCSLAIVIFPIGILLAMLCVAVPVIFILGLFATIVGILCVFLGIKIGLIVGISVCFLICVLYNRIRMIR